jgi:two-component system, NtrC family, response regulator HydG
MMPLPNSMSSSDGHLVHGMVGLSAPMRRVHEFVVRVALADTTVLIQGESGTGKELVARAIHRNSNRAGGPLVIVNCAAIPEQLLESELFGHVRGAFTGAATDKKGKFELADGGTLFLDEIGELPMALQPKILRALQEREFERLGGTRSIRVDIRVVAATNADLRTAVASKAFRQDLYYRLDVVSLRLPALRERRADIPLLAEHFLAEFSGSLGRKPPAISSEARTCLMDYDWPGNVRELQNVIERALVMGSSSGMIQAGDLPKALTRAPGAASGPKPGYARAVQQFKAQLILDALQQARGCFTEAAAILGVHPNYLHRLVTTMDLRGVARKQVVAEMPLRFARVSCASPVFNVAAGEK